MENYQKSHQAMAQLKIIFLLYIQDNNTEKEERKKSRECQIKVWGYYMQLPETLQLFRRFEEGPG